MRTNGLGHGRLAGPLASVRPDPTDWHVAHVPLVDLSELHWDAATSTPGRAGDGPTLCGFTTCDRVVAGELPHEACARAHPHAVRVCILKDDNDRDVFDRLKLEAGPPPRPIDERQAHAVA
jgi:hypothetical protein